MRESEFSVLHRAALTDLEFWAEFSYDHPANGVVLFPQGLERSIATDASGDLAWGAELLLPGFRPGRMEAHPAPERTAQGFWAGTSVEGSHITIKELKAVHFGILAFQEELRGKVVRLWEDNQAVVHIIRNGTSKAPDLMQHLRALWRDLVRLAVARSGAPSTYGLGTSAPHSTLRTGGRASPRAPTGPWTGLWCADLPRGRAISTLSRVSTQPRRQPSAAVARSPERWLWTACPSRGRRRRSG